jgi:ComF family protein
MTSVRSLTNAVLAALLAPPCAACGRIIDAPLDGAVCAGCWDTIVPAPAPFTLRGIVSARAIGAYEGSLRAIVHALKYDGRRSVAPRLSRLLATCGHDVLSTADGLVPVPLHPRRVRERGFNQAEDLARGLGLPILHAIGRVRHTQPQVDLAAADRHRNVRDAFRATGRPDLRGKTIVLVDDVSTTGATLEACARALQDAGARELRAVIAARAVPARR